MLDEPLEALRYIGKGVAAQGRRCKLYGAENDLGDIWGTLYMLMDCIKVLYEGLEALGYLGKAVAAQERRGKLLAGGGKTTGHKGGQGRLETIKLMLGRVEKGEEGRRRLRGL